MSTAASIAQSNTQGMDAAIICVSRRPDVTCACLTWLRRWCVCSSNDELALVTGDDDDMDVDDARPFQAYPPVQDSGSSQRRHDVLPLESYSRSTPPSFGGGGGAGGGVIRNPYCGHSYECDSLARLMADQGEKAV